MLKIEENIPLGPMTSFRIGGRAEFYCTIWDVKDLEEAVRWAEDKRVPLVVLGGCSNVLVNDFGVKGLVVRMKMNKISVEGHTIFADAGAPLIKVVNMAAESGLGGMEGLAGIPGSLGGAVRGNAGAFGAQTADKLESVTFYDLRQKTIRELPKESCAFAYRSSVFKGDAGKIITGAKFVLTASEAKEVQEKTAGIVKQRAERGLHGMRSAGSFFMNPIVEDENLRQEFSLDQGKEPKDERLPAGWFVDKAGLGGKRIGGAMVSKDHANYIINFQDATASDVAMLSSFVKQQVRDKFGVQLQEEVSYLGF